MVNTIGRCFIYITPIKLIDKILLKFFFRNKEQSGFILLFYCSKKVILPDSEINLKWSKLL